MKLLRLIKLWWMIRQIKYIERKYNVLNRCDYSILDEGLSLYKAVQFDLCACHNMARLIDTDRKDVVDLRDV